MRLRRSVERRIFDILLAIERCERYVDSLESDDVALADMAKDASERNLQIIGEATNHLPEEVTSVHPRIAWPQIRGFRNILVHQYFGIDPDIVRDVIQNHLPPLASALRDHISR